MKNQYQENQRLDYDANPFAIDDTFQSDIPPNVHLYEPSQNKFRWHHIEDLDTFFSRIYNYHQKNGFLCMMVEEAFEPLQFLFVVFLSFFLLHCINYSQLFRSPKWVSHNSTSLKGYLDTSNSQNIHERISLWDALEPISVCTHKHYRKTHPFLIICLILAAIFLLMRILRIFQHFFQYLEIRSFYINALKINTDDLPNTTWQDVQTQLKRVQLEQRLCIHKAELSDLDIHHRILRFQNYMVAFVNKDLFPLHINVPFLGEVILLSQAMEYNLEMILFWGPWSPFRSNWQLKEEYKKSAQRMEMASRLSSHILWVAIINLILSPVILIWQVLYFFFNYGQLMKNEPGALLGTRRWSPYARLYFRHYNELDHELRSRLARAYPHARKYLASFVSPLSVVLAKNVCFFTGSVLAVIVVLTLIDEDVLLSTEYVLTFATVLGVVYGACRALVPPDEHEAPCDRRTLMDRVLAHVHYLPVGWEREGTVHKGTTRDAFAARFFELRLAHLAREMVSALAVPYVLLACLRPRALRVVDFLCNYTVEVDGVGDVCSLARMTRVRTTDGDHVIDESATSTRETATPPVDAEVEDDGGELRPAVPKTTLSLVNFTAGRNILEEEVRKDMRSTLSPDHERRLDTSSSSSDVQRQGSPSSKRPVADDLDEVLPTFGLRSPLTDISLKPEMEEGRYLDRSIKPMNGSLEFEGKESAMIQDDDMTSFLASLVTMSSLGGGYSLVANDMLRNITLSRSLLTPPSRFSPPPNNFVRSPPPSPIPEDGTAVSDHRVIGGEEALDNATNHLTTTSFRFPPRPPTMNPRGYLSYYNSTAAAPFDPDMPHVLFHQSLLSHPRGSDPSTWVRGSHVQESAVSGLVVPHTNDTVIPYSTVDMSLTVLYLYNKSRNQQQRTRTSSSVYLPQQPTKSKGILSKYRRHTSLDDEDIVDDPTHSSAPRPPVESTALLTSMIGKSVKFKDLISTSSRHFFGGAGRAKVEEGADEQRPLLMKSFQASRYDV